MVQLTRCAAHGSVIGTEEPPEERSMVKKIRAVRGRVPSLESATERARELRKGLRALVSELGRLESRLRTLDTLYKKRQDYYRKALADAADIVAHVPRSPAKALRGRGPNVREVAFGLLKKHRSPMPIQKLADMVIREKGGDPGANFVQNLGAALQRDRRFRRMARGVYGLRKAA